jgi:UrcA family protein
MLCCSTTMFAVAQNLPKQWCDKGKRSEGLLSEFNDNPEIDTMKRMLITAAATLTLAGAAYAQPVTVMVPSDLSTKESVELYKSKLESAINEVCRRAAGPVVGVAYYTYKACVANTRADVAASEPTGLYGKKADTTLTLAAK